MLFFAILLIYWSFKQQKISRLQIEDFERNEKNTALKRFVKGLESWENIIPRINTIETDRKAIMVLMKLRQLLHP